MDSMLARVYTCSVVLPCMVSRPGRSVAGNSHRLASPEPNRLLSPQPPVQVAHRELVPSSLPIFFSSSLLSMSSLLAQYESFLVAHVSTISSLESTLRSITWLLPGRFKDAELASEAR